MFFGFRTLRQLSDRSTPQDLAALWRRYIVALALIFGLLMTSHVFSRLALHHGAHDASTINTSGRQRMLLQRMAHAAHDFAEDGDPADRDKLEASAAEFRATHAYLVARAEAEPSLRTLYTGGDLPLDEEVYTLLAHVDDLLANPQQASEMAGRIDAMADGDLAERLNAAVTAFEMLAERRSTQLTRIQDLSLLAAVLMLFAEILLIFWPSHQAISSAFARLQTERDRNRETLDRLSHFATLASDFFWETDVTGRIIYAEGSFLERLKGGRENIVGCDYRDLIQLTEKNLAELTSAIRSLGSYKDVVGTFTDTDGQSYKLSLSGMPHYHEDGHIIGYLGTATDVTARMTQQEQTELMASTDPLTGLANVRKFRATLGNMVDTADSRQPVYVLALDLDGFKSVNDTYGHGAGDEVLKSVASRMKATLRESDWCARIGGDEFFVVCHTAPSRLAVEGLALRLNRKLAEPYGLSTGHRVRVSASIGIAAAPYDSTDLDKLLHLADTALYDAKNNGRNQFRFVEDIAPAPQDAKAS